MKHRRHHNHLRNLILWTGLALTPFLLLLLQDEAKDFIKNLRTSTQEPLHVEDANAPVFNLYHLVEEQEDAHSRPRVYPYSVVDGGVHSVKELQSAIHRDPVVARHYSGFRLDTARVIEAETNGDFHVSYRIGQEIFWTKKKLRVAKGEKLITDGTNFTRTRCANMLSEVPRGKSSPNEPMAEVLDAPRRLLPDLAPGALRDVIGGDPPATALPSPDPSTFTPPVIEEGGPSGSTLPPSDPPPFVPPGGIGGGPTVPGDGSPGDGGNGGGNGNPPVPAPEPITLLLLGSGLVGLWKFRKRFKK